MAQTRMWFVNSRGFRRDNQFTSNERFGGKIANDYSAEGQEATNDNLRNAACSFRLSPDEF